VENNSRLRELDSMRGLAALSVLAGHIMLINALLSADTWGNHRYMLVNLIKYTPLRIFWAGDEAVIFFFVLSGFVLSLPFYREFPRYSGFLIRRVCRIYIPYIVAVSLALVARLRYNTPVTGTSSWFNQTWAVPLSRNVLLQHLILVGSLQNYALDPPIWSLAQEMRISLVFPLIMLFVVKMKWRWTLLAGACLALLSFRHGLYTPSGTLNYILFFIIGALLAKHRTEIDRYLKNVSSKRRVLLFVVGIVLYTWRWWSYGFIERVPVLDYWVVSIGVSVFIALAMSSKRVKRILCFKPLHFAGKISYSIYLFHMIIVTSIFHELYGKAPLAVLLVGSVLLSILTASITYYLVEVPSFLLGRRLANATLHLRTAKWLDEKILPTQH
jgi:peptidoglycan/LPS O-acetylase OafA/YrhL